MSTADTPPTYAPKPQDPKLYEPKYYEPKHYSHLISFPPIQGSTDLVRTWLKKWFEVHELRSDEVGKCVGKVYWNGHDLNDVDGLGRHEVVSQLVAWGFERGYAFGIAVDIERARGVRRIRGGGGW
ncbi:hypothetical protein GLAREA_06154 [Glarea lozoyensis ATCC 20868]|uniref:Uncharacterized protein n=1 Tax=Glarea lozoyensis (strain ATCC 20868 / MF5171) TaxID=1116229 RepID=S3D3T8_GLAL2|nr:uncharacterized protein GLAREA_06154 [Glarea lozoyensis ATCC 20868]EPE33142.1 hypothetical protein GLAREA_06154 [Glarea lozoyensis ATCC 20868]